MFDSMVVMPLLVLNMGSEMIYILCQRLGAQNIGLDKKARVVHDILKAMSSDKFLEELFRPCSLYTHEATRQIFERLAHCSIMRLSATSMDKLYDLMRMGFKYQILACASADQLLQLTIVHLETVRKLSNGQEDGSCIGHVIERIIERYSDMSAGAFFGIKECLCRFFQDVTIKVSLFLQSGLQNADGTLITHFDEYTASGGEVPGILHYYAPDGTIKKEGHFTILSAVNTFKAPEVPILDRPSLSKHQIGSNLYDAEPKCVQSGEMFSARADISRHKQFSGTASDGINLLGALIGAAPYKTDAKDGDMEKVRINLFSMDYNDTNSHEDDQSLDSKSIPCVHIDASNAPTSSKLAMSFFGTDQESKSCEHRNDDIGLEDFLLGSRID